MRACSTPTSGNCASPFSSASGEVVKETRPGCLVCPQNQGTFYGLAKRAPLVDYSSQEALFTDAHHYGYHYFPTVIRYARGFGIPFHGCTVIFKDFWADFGGLKSPAQMHTEVAAFVSQGARCDIGDQVPPDGRLDPAVYHVIGQAYQHIERIEPYLEQAVPVTEAALLASGDAPCNEVNYGWVKLLTESRVQFDIVERETKWEDRYALVVLPENLWVDQALASRLHAFIAGGGAVIAAHKSGLLAGTEKSWLERYGLHYAGMSPFTPAYMVPKVNFTGDIPSYAYALYEGASQWRAESPGGNPGRVGRAALPAQPRALHEPSANTLRSHHLLRRRGTERAGWPGGFSSGTRLLQPGILDLSPGLSESAQRSASRALDPERCPPDHRTVVDSSGGEAERGRKERYMVHIVNFSPVRRTPKHTDFHDDPIPLSNVTVRVNLPLQSLHGQGALCGPGLAGAPCGRRRRGGPRSPRGHSRGGVF